MLRSPSLATWALIALVCGLALGLLGHGSDSTVFAVIENAVKPLGAIWMAALQFVLLPLIAAQLLAAITGAPDGARIGRLGVRAIGLRPRLDGPVPDVSLHPLDARVPAAAARAIWRGVFGAGLRFPGRADAPAGASARAGSLATSALFAGTCKGAVASFAARGNGAGLGDFASSRFGSRGARSAGKGATSTRIGSRRIRIRIDAPASNTARRASA